MDETGLVIIGGGGHARVVLSLCRLAEISVNAIVDDDPALVGRVIGGVGVLGRDSLRPGMSAVVAIGDNLTRRRVVQELASRLLQYPTLIHPRAFVDRSVILGAGVVVCAGAVIQCDSQIGAHSIINTSVSVDHDNRIGAFSHLAPGCHLAGSVTVEEGALLGTGCVLTPGRQVGAWSIVGAGSVIVKDVEAGATVMGNPAKTRQAPAGIDPHSG